MDQEEQINLPAIMILHIARIANTTREHDLLLLTHVFEHFGVDLKKKVEVQMIDKIRSSTLMACGFTLVEGPASKQGIRTPFSLVLGSSSSGPSVEALLQDQSQLKTELTEVKGALVEEKALNAKCHENLLALLSALSATVPSCSLKHSCTLFLCPVLFQALLCF